MFKKNINRIIECKEKTILRKYQLTLLEMLKEIHEICEKNKIEYWIDSGTLLGAIRHKGFIPWDDDLDICMTRSNYEKFIEVIEKSLPDGMLYEMKHSKGWIQDDIDIRLSFLKIYYTEKFTSTEDYLDAKFKGAYIDVFPIDYVNEKMCSNGINRLISKLTTIERRKVTQPKHVLKIILDKFNIEKIWIKKCEKLYKFQEKKLLVYGVETPFMKKSYIQKHEDIFPLKKIQFEGYEFFAPNNYHNYLTKLYGDYMKIPKLEDRTCHLKNLSL